MDTRIRVALLLGMAAAALFVALARRNLEAQGLYQDEVLQASGSFAYVGGPPIAAMSVFGVPVLNNSYLGAIKTGVYGLYMRITGRGFTVVSWRMVGILAVALGIVAFSLLACRALPPLPLAAGLLLLATDATAVLMTRHDWGPTALAMLLRLLLIAMLLREECDRRAAHANSFVVGALIGVSAFEKLSSLALLGPLAIAAVFQPFRRSPRAVGALIVGGLVGGLPLLAVNTLSFLHDRTLVSLSDADPRLRPPLAEFIRAFPEEFLSIGAGGYARRTILGDEDSAGEAGREMFLTGALLAVTIGISAWKLRERPEFRAAAVLALSVFGVAAVLYALPRRTAIHHHIQAIPFAYIGAAAALAGLGRLKVRRLAERSAGCVLAALLVLLLGNHGYTMTRVEGALRDGRAGVYFDKAFTSLGYFGASKRKNAVFILADWGVGTAIHCLAQGPASLTYEVFWNYKGPSDLDAVVDASRRNTVYLVTPTRTGIAPETAARINRDAGLLPDWKEIEPEPEAAALKPLIVVRKFDVRRPPAR